MLFRTLVLLFTCWVLIATSTLSDSIEGSMTLTSDCVLPVLEQTVTATNGVITAPGGVNFTDFGFPLNTVTLGQANSGPVSTFQRECKPTYGDERFNNDEWIWSCFDDGEYTCSIFLRK